MNKSILAAVIACTLATGCVTIPDINESFRRIDRVWALEYQRSEDSLRARVVDAPYTAVFESVRTSFLALGLPVESQNPKAGVLMATGSAPIPLTAAEWSAVIEEEAPRVKSIGGWYMVLSESSTKDYTVKLTATITPLADKTVVLLSYEMDAPKYRSMGIEPSKHAPPKAVQIATARFWETLGAELAKINVQKPRSRSSAERDA